MAVQQVIPNKPKQRWWYISTNIKDLLGFEVPDSYTPIDATCRNERFTNTHIQPCDLSLMETLSKHLEHCMFSLDECR